MSASIYFNRSSGDLNYWQSKVHQRIVCESKQTVFTIYIQVGQEQI